MEEKKINYPIDLLTEKTQIIRKHILVLSCKYND